MRNGISLIFIAIGWSIAIPAGNAVIIPSGTGLVVRTAETIASNDPVGKKFAAQLFQDVVANGKILVRAGTPVVGRVEASRGLQFTPVILNISELTIGQRSVPIMTVDGFRADGRHKTRRGVSVGRGGFFTVPTGTVMQFRLAKPVDLGDQRAGHFTESGAIKLAGNFDGGLNR